MGQAHKIVKDSGVGGMEHSVHPGISSLFLRTPAYSGSRKNCCALQTRAFSFSVSLSNSCKWRRFCASVASHRFQCNPQSLLSLLVVAWGQLRSERWERALTPWNGGHCSASKDWATIMSIPLSSVFEVSLCSQSKLWSAHYLLWKLELALHLLYPNTESPGLCYRRSELVSFSNLCMLQSFLVRMRQEVSPPGEPCCSVRWRLWSRWGRWREVVGGVPLELSLTSQAVSTFWKIFRHPLSFNTGGGSHLLKMFICLQNLVRVEAYSELVSTAAFTKY